MVDYFETAGNYIRCTHGGTYTFIFDASTKTLTIKAGFVDEAYQFAFYFNNTVTCTGRGSINHGDISLGEFWGNIEDEFNSLSLDAKLYLKDLNAGEYGNEMQTCLYRYDYIVFYKQYSECNNFMNRTSTYNYLSSKNVSNISGSNVASIIVLLAVTQVAILSILVVIKKKRSDIK